MSDVIIRIPTPLRSFTQGAGEVQVSAATVGEALEVLELRHQGILERVLDADGRVRGFVNIFVDDRNIRSMEGLGSSINGAKTISIVPAVAGGLAGEAGHARPGRAARGRESSARRKVCPAGREEAEGARGGPSGGGS